MAGVISEFCYKSDAFDFPHKFCYSNVEMKSPPESITRIKQVPNSASTSPYFSVSFNDDGTQVLDQSPAFSDASYHALSYGFNSTTCVSLRETPTGPGMYACAKHDDERAIIVNEFRPLFPS